MFAKFYIGKWKHIEELVSLNETIDARGLMSHLTCVRDEWGSAWCCRGYRRRLIVGAFNTENADLTPEATSIFTNGLHGTTIKPVVSKWDGIRRGCCYASSPAPKKSLPSFPSAALNY